MDKKWNLQDIRPAREEKSRPSTRRRPAKEARRPVETREEVGAPRPRRRKRRSGNGIDLKKLLPIGGVLVAVVLIGFVVSLFFGGAEVTVNPKHRETNVQSSFTAYQQPAAGQLGYELLTLEAEGERQVTANGEEEVETRAEGTITIYNTYSTSPQRLITNTRFESPDGLIFRIDESVEVPGYTEDSEGNKVPGSIEADVFADGVGEEYNIDPTEFTVPGLEGTDQYDDIYAQSETAFSGGFEGAQYIVDEGELEEAQSSLHAELRDALMSRLESERPADAVLYEDAITFRFESLPATDSGNQTATIKERGVLTVPLFTEGALAKMIAEQTIAGYEGEPVALRDPYALTFAYTAEDEQTLSSSFEFSLSGSTEVVWQFDEAQLKNDLRGVSKSALTTILSGYPAIERAEATIKPFWSRTFPENEDDITLTITIGDSE